MEQELSLSTPRAAEVLPAGSVVGGYRITGLIGRGGFGIVYRAESLANGATVAIKEFFPADIAGRVHGRLAPRKPELQEALLKGIERFSQEAALLSELSHPALVSVIETWRESGTAYLAMTFYDGVTLRRLREALAAPPSEDQLRAWFEPIIDAVLELHVRRVIHRDISPDNILICRDGRSVLLDLGAARQVLGGMTQALTTVLKPGYAPIEQYVDDGSMSQGRWTDVYGLAGTLFFAVTGQAPVTATSRLVRDTQPDLASLPAARHLRPAFCAGVMRGLAVRAIERPKSLPEFKTALGWGAPPGSVEFQLLESDPTPSEAASLTSLSARQTASAPVGSTRQTRRSNWRVAVLALGVAAVLWALWLAR
ncbi:MAG: serine/threonine-protein kinase [Casimicrobiaceae bacterium]